jgi:hypothetical protein
MDRDQINWVDGDENTPRSFNKIVVRSPVQKSASPGFKIYGYDAHLPIWRVPLATSSESPSRSSSSATGSSAGTPVPPPSPDEQRRRGAYALWCITQDKDSVEEYVKMYRRTCSLCADLSGPELSGYNTVKTSFRKHLNDDIREKMYSLWPIEIREQASLHSLFEMAIQAEQELIRCNGGPLVSDVIRCRRNTMATGSREDENRIIRPVPGWQVDRKNDHRDSNLKRHQQRRVERRYAIEPVEMNPGNESIRIGDLRPVTVHRLMKRELCTEYEPDLKEQQIHYASITNVIEEVFGEEPLVEENEKLGTVRCAVSETTTHKTRCTLNNTDDPLPRYRNGIIFALRANNHVSVAQLDSGCTVSFMDGAHVIPMGLGGQVRRCCVPLDVLAYDKSRSVVDEYVNVDIAIGKPHQYVRAIVPFYLTKTPLPSLGLLLGCDILLSDALALRADTDRLRIYLPKFFDNDPGVFVNMMPRLSDKELIERVHAEAVPTFPASWKFPGYPEPGLIPHQRISFPEQMPIVVGTAVDKYYIYTDPRPNRAACVTEAPMTAQEEQALFCQYLPTPSD